MIKTEEQNLIDALAKEKAEEILLKKEISDINNSLRDIISILPTTLVELKKTIDIIYNNCRDNSNERKEESKKLLIRLEEITNKFQELDKKINKISSYTEISEVIVNSLEKIIIDKNNKDSLLVVINNLFEDLTKIINDEKCQDSIVVNFNKFKTDLNLRLEEISKKLDFKANLKKNIAWLVATIATIVTVLSKIGII